MQPSDVERRRLGVGGHDLQHLVRHWPWVWALLRLENRHLKRFHKIEAQATEMILELTSEALGEVASELVHDALDKIGHGPDEKGIEVLPSLYAGFGAVYV